MKSMSTMFSSPVSIRLSSPTSVWREARTDSTVRKPTSVVMTLVTCGLITLPIG
ncbi:hypothetical protein D3C72_2393390 [compost metagenome]